MAGRAELLAAAAEDDVPQRLEALADHLTELAEALARSPLNAALDWLRTQTGQRCPCEATARQP